jgi:hypothetical protein
LTEPAKCISYDLLCGVQCQQRLGSPDDVDIETGLELGRQHVHQGLLKLTCILFLKRSCRSQTKRAVLEGTRRPSLAAAPATPVNEAMLMKNNESLWFSCLDTAPDRRT